MKGVFVSIADILAFEGYYEDIGSDPSFEHRMMTGNYPNAANAYKAAF